MDTLIEHFAAAADLRVAAPFFFHAEASAVAVAAADEHEGADRVFVNQLASADHGGMESVAEADLHDDAGIVRCVEERLKLLRISRARFFQQDMFAGLNRCERGGY